MESISQTMFVSNGTIMNDMNKLETFFQKQGLELERKVKNTEYGSGEPRS